jgi:hypothetical protein
LPDGIHSRIDYAGDYHTVLDEHRQEIPMDNNDYQLDLAIAAWECGEDIPFDLEVALLMKGYDVEALRNQHLN